jgi:hypothetical protein
MLLSGMMAFLFTIFALTSMDTSQAIYNRIIVQNSVDAAADAAALWQARGCNLVQNLNNYHYEANQFFATTEANALNSCFLADLLGICAKLNIPYFSQACAVGQKIVCKACASAWIWDDAQDATAQAILTEQQWIITTTPYIALIAANEAAQGSGADELLTSVGAYGNKLTAAIGLPIDLTGIASAGTSILKTFGINISAWPLPLDLKSLGLGLNPVSGSTSPWKFGPCSAYVLMGKAPQIGCGLQDPEKNWGPEKQYDNNWGWYDDQYYVGRPGYMTWFAGKTNQPTVLGFLRWLNPNPTPPAEVPYWLNQTGLPMYNGAVLSSSSDDIPAYIAFASSQVDRAPGTTWSGVVANGSANAYPYLIPVYFPGIGAGTSIWIFH